MLILIPTSKMHDYPAPRKVNLTILNPVSPIQARIQLAAIRHNLAVVRRLAPRSRVMGVVKADAYGHGAITVAKTLVASGVDALAVATLAEALSLRQAGVDSSIFLLQGPAVAGDMVDVVRLKLGLVLHSAYQLVWLQGLPVDAAIEVFVKLDSGMHRLGFAPEDVAAVLSQLRQAPGVVISGLMSHLARADTPLDPYNAMQLAQMQAAASGQDLPLSLANSAALLRLPETHLHWVRPGLMLYGMSPFADVDANVLGLRPVMQWVSRIVAVRTLAAGDFLGYGAAFQATAPMRVGVVAAGYGDGYARQLGTGTPMLVGGQHTRLLGRVCMDMLFVDLTALPEAQVGDEVLLMGAQGGMCVSAETLAGLMGTIPYEMTCRVQARVPRVVVDG